MNPGCYMELKSGEQTGSLEIVEGKQGKFCKKVLRIPRNAAKGAVEIEVARDTRRGKILCAEIEHWIRVKQSAEVEPMRQDYD
jgi:hypothetical protein